MLFCTGPSLLIINCSLLICLSSCSVERRIAKHAQTDIINDSLLSTAHVGICVYDATNNKYLYNYQSDKYFIPASNTKIATCYTAMKYLGDSLVGLRYELGDSAMYIFPTGDPTFLHGDFKVQPVLTFLQKQTAKIYLSRARGGENPWGVGWSWDDYNDDYMAERSTFPLYGNVVKFHLLRALINDSMQPLVPKYTFQTIPSYFSRNIKFAADSESIVFKGPHGILTSTTFKLERSLSANDFFIKADGGRFSDVSIPFSTLDTNLVVTILEDTLHKKIYKSTERSYLEMFPETKIIHSQPTDSLLKIMMHRSDNFYAEQSLLMVGNEKLGVMSDAQIIDTLLKADLKEFPQRPQWVDGSGLSRFNLFTPQDFVFMLNKIRNEFSWNRITTIFSTGGDGTLGSYYKGLKGKIFAKTGSLSNNIALSGYLITQKNKTLIFSVLVNNHTVSSAGIRRAVERFLTAVQKEN